MNINRLISFSANHTQSSLVRVDYLDGWRGLAIALVLQAHFFKIPFLNSGRLGVDIFFVLSGLLMGNILFIKRTPLTIFYKRRASRIFPAFFLFVIATYSFGYIYLFSFTTKEVVATLTFMRTYLPAGNDIWKSSLPIGHIWSLNVEEHGYLIMSLLTIPAIFRKKAWIPLGIISLGTIAIHIAYIYKIFPPPITSEAGLRTECALTHLMLSAAYCQFANKFRQRVEPWMTFMAFCGACLCYTKIFPWWSSLLIGPFLLAFVVNHLSETWEAVRDILAHPVFRLLGIWSFSIYLWQQPFYTYKESFPPGVALCLAIICGLLSFYFVENPIRGYLNRRW